MNKHTQDLILANVQALNNGEPLEYFPAWGEIVSKDTIQHVFKVKISIGNGWNQGDPVGWFTFESLLDGDKWMTRVRRANTSKCLSFDIELYFNGQPEPMKIIDYEPNPEKFLVELAQDKLAQWEYIKKSPNVYKIYGGLAKINERVEFWCSMIANEGELE